MGPLPIKACDVWEKSMFSASESLNAPLIRLMSLYVQKLPLEIYTFIEQVTK